MREDIVVLGATGSIGRQTLDILRYSFSYRLVGVSFASNYEKREPYLLYFPDLEFVGIVDEEKAKAFRFLHPSYTVFSGKDASLEVIKACKGANVFNSIRGNDGLLPSLCALSLNRDLRLSNKESLIIGSSLLKQKRKQSSSRLYPVDSEHVALAKLLFELERRNIPEKDIRTLYITASGGALRDYPIDQLSKVAPEQVLSHPTWRRGSKITVDCATRVNKAFEIREAKALFPMPDFVSYKAVVCKESLVHALVSFINEEGKEETIYEYSPVDRKVSIAYALSKGTLPRHKNSEEDLSGVRKLHFLPLDPLRYPCYSLALKRNEKYGNIGRLYFNETDSLAISSFLRKEIPYLDIKECLAYTLNHFQSKEPLTEDHLDSILYDAKAFAGKVLYEIKRKGTL